MLGAWGIIIFGHCFLIHDCLRIKMTKKILNMKEAQGNEKGVVLVCVLSIVDVHTSSEW